MLVIWTGPKVGHSPPSIPELKDLTEGVIRELGHTGQRAAALRQKMHPHLYPDASAAPVRPLLADEDKIRAQCQQLSDQLGLPFTDLLSRVGLSDD